MLNIYLKHQWSIIPLTYGTKRPIYKWSIYKTKRPTEQDWEKWILKHKNLNMAVVCGSISNLVAIDIDKEEGLKTFLSLNEQPDTPTMITPNGYRFFFKGSCPTSHYKCDSYSISILGEGAISLLPPSKHPSGKFYKWKDYCSLDDTSLKEYTQIKLPQKKIVNENNNIIKEGLRNTSLFKLGCAISKYIKDPENILHYINDNYCYPPLNKNEIQILSKSINRYNV